MFQFEFHGFVNFEMFYDTRQVVAAREGNVILYPAKVNPDPDGVDLNAIPALQMSLLSSRMQAGIKGPDFFGAKTSALFEVDFLGTGADKFNLLRMRHALVKLNWERTELLAGQYWHPLFITSCFPGVIHFGGGVPYNVLNRSPQLRLTHKAGNISLMAALLAQSDFASNGPNGYSSQYLRNSGLPETWTQLIFERDRFLAGASAGLLTLRPRIQTPAGYQTKENKTSFAGNAFVKYRFEHLQVKAQGTWGENLSHLVMLGGYGEAQMLDPEKAIWSYSGIRSMAAWIDVEETSGKWHTGLFGGFSKNLGSKQELMGNVWGRGADISHIYRIAPRIGYFIERASFNLELVYDVAAYGTPDEYYSINNTQQVNNLRTMASIKYNF
ncbi:MAG: hypothetical protein K0B09_04225 [Bacteroidales bacterium]|nr:hypothetical protein [Bacteroidales bacterium]